MSKRSCFNIFIASTLLLGAAFGCGRAPETPAIPPEVAAAHSVDYSQAADGEVVLLTSDKEYDDFVKSSPVAVVKFGAEWCPPCRAFEPDLRRQAGYFAERGVKFAEVDVDELGDKARKLGVQSIPDVRVYLDGRAYEQIVGYQPHTLANLLDAICEPAPKTTSEKAAAPAKPAEKPLEEELWPEE
jgi:thioredoxin 1